ncbi:MAG: hypothetical protein LBF22_04800 [Deltaproteobacteria bacterium]|nr:hypothetical protein [Deltaproteobacteria bacterium]
MDEEDLDLTLLGINAVLAGEILWEHTAAGEASRLNLGPKFNFTPSLLVKKAQELGIPCAALSSYIPLELGRRHIFQLVFEILKLAHIAGKDLKSVMSRQKMLIIGSTDHMLQILLRIIYDLRGLIPIQNIWSMGQGSFHGLEKISGKWEFDPRSPKYLHNHGSMAMQKTMENQIYHFDSKGQLSLFTRKEFFEELSHFKDLVSYNIEDLDYLTTAIDFGSLGLAIQKKEAGYGMMMEVVFNNPERPIKGGLCAFDPILQQDVMIESFRLKGILPENIRYLNKNFNHYLNPQKTFQKLNEEGLFMPVLVKDGYLYFQPVQGDINFLTKTVFFRRKTMTSINSLKSPEDIPNALKAMESQDKQPGFKKIIEIQLENQI